MDEVEELKIQIEKLKQFLAAAEKSNTDKYLEACIEHHMSRTGK